MKTLNQIEQDLTVIQEALVKEGSSLSASLAHRIDDLKEVHRTHALNLKLLGISTGAPK